MRRLLVVLALSLTACGLPGKSVDAGLHLPPKAVPLPAGASIEAIYGRYCGTCHSLALPESQRLDRRAWADVLDDMEKRYGVSWMPPAEREALIAYLVAKQPSDWDGILR